MKQSIEVLGASVKCGDVVDVSQYGQPVEVWIDGAGALGVCDGEGKPSDVPKTPGRVVCIYAEERAAHSVLDVRWGQRGTPGSVKATYCVAKRKEQ